MNTSKLLSSHLTLVLGSRYTPNIPKHTLWYEDRSKKEGMHIYLPPN